MPAANETDTVGRLEDVRIVTLYNGSEKWDRFVEFHPFGMIYHLSTWKNILEASFGHIKGCFICLEDDAGNIVCGLPIYQVKSRLVGNRLVSIPFASISDPLIHDSTDLVTLLGSAVFMAKSLSSKYVEIRSCFSQETLQRCSLTKICLYKHHYLPLDREPGKLMKMFHRSCVRQRISRSLKSGLKFKIGEGEADLYKFHQLHSMSRKRLGLPRQPYAFLKSLWHELRKTNMVSLHLAEKDDQPIAGHVLLKYKNRVSAEFAAYDSKWLDLSPNHFLFWKAIEKSYHEGYEIFDFGRTLFTNKGLMSFKDRWGTKVIDLPQFYYTNGHSKNPGKINQSWKYKSISSACRHLPDMFQNFLGNFCYHHLG